MVGRIWEKMFGATYGREPSTRGWSREGIISAMAPIDAALYDIMTKSVGLPLFKFLGGYRDSVPVYVTGGYYREGKGIPELVQEIRGYIDQGFNAIKLKVGGVSGGNTVEDDYQRVEAVRKAVGPAVRIMLDANNGWDVETTIRASNKMYDLDITWLEEPLRWIASNAGHEGSIVLDKVKNGKGAFGFNALKEEYEDLLKAGIIDPTKVVRTALLNAASIAGLMLTTEAMVAEKPEPKGSGAPAMPGGGMGGMGGMM